jgi:type III restriction enzyme
MRLKEFQERALADVRNYLELLLKWKTQAEKSPESEIDYPSKAWEKVGNKRPYVPRKNGIAQPLPDFCLKIPTGGGKTFLAVKTIDLVDMIYRRKQTGLVLWIVPTTQIYRQTILSLKNREHPYRQHLDLASGGRTIIVEKTDRFTPLDIETNLVVVMLMLPSANRKTKEVLRVFKDSGGFQDFFPPEDDVKGQNALLKQFPNLDTYERESGFWGRQIKTSLGNTLRILSPLIILDEGHKAYSEGAQATLRGFNPCLIVELSATPADSNILVDISGREIHREEMIKLDLHIVNKASPDWKNTMLAGYEKRNLLEEKARTHEANTGISIRPICLIQVERTGKDQRGGKFIHSEDVREHLIKVLGVPADEVAVKTSEKDELKEIDDVGGLMAKDCRIRFIITKQALQEGWDCAFAYVLVILTNPASKNALTQLVGRILRQPFAKKTGLQELDESYVYCFQQKAASLLEQVRNGFEQEGLGDLRGRIVSDDGTGNGDLLKEKQVGIRDKFKKAARNTFLPVFVIKDGPHWRPVKYETDISSRIPWTEIDLDPLFELSLSTEDKKDVEFIEGLSDDKKELLKQKGVRLLEGGGLQVDPVFMTRQLLDVVPNPWRVHQLAQTVLGRLGQRYDPKTILNNFVFIIEETRGHLNREKDRLAEIQFRALLKSRTLRFNVIGKSISYRFPDHMSIRPKYLNRKDGTQLQLSLFESLPEDDFNETEKEVAWYLEGQKKLFFWYRNRPRLDYGLQGWREHRIYPDFVFTSKIKEEASPYERIYVIETKGLHLKDNDKTQYIQRLFKICNHEAHAIGWGELGLKLDDRSLRYEVLSEGEWEAKLNEFLEHN